MVQRTVTWPDRGVRTALASKSLRGGGIKLVMRGTHTHTFALCSQRQADRRQQWFEEVVAFPLVTLVHSASSHINLVLAQTFMSQTLSQKLRTSIKGSSPACKRNHRIHRNAIDTVNICERHLLLCTCFANVVNSTLPALLAALASLSVQHRHVSGSNLSIQGLAPNISWKGHTRMCDANTVACFLSAGTARQAHRVCGAVILTAQIKLKPTREFARDRKLVVCKSHIMFIDSLTVPEKPSRCSCYVAR